MHKNSKLLIVPPLANINLMISKYVDWNGGK